MKPLFSMMVALACSAVITGCDPAKPPATAGSATPQVSPPPSPPQPPSGPVDPKLDPSNPVFKAKAPDVFRARFLTTKGEFDVRVTRAWAPNGADHFYALVKAGFYNDLRFFRVVPNFMAQFGIHGDPRVAAKFSNWNIPDDPRVRSNVRGMLVYAKTNNPNSRSTQLFINFKDNSASLDPQDFAPFGEVTEGMDTVDAVNAEYGESPDQGVIQRSGNLYLDTEFPRLTRILSVRILE
jgi:peptidyl-prolyl cis-trans isomerase A (cyclophilin A)